MYRQILVHLPPHTWTVCGQWTPKMYHKTKLHSFMWTPSCYFWGCHSSFNEVGLREPLAKESALLSN